MNQSLKESVTKIEAAVVGEMRPHFLAITVDEGFVHIVITHPSFVMLPMKARVQKVLEAINKREPELIKTTPIMVQAFCANELEDLFEYWLEGEL